MEHQQLPQSAEEKILLGSNSEQRQRIDEALYVTMVNGQVVNRRSSVLAFWHRNAMGVVWHVPGVPSWTTFRAFAERF